MGTPRTKRTTPDGDADKHRALRHVTTTANRRRKAESAELAAIRFARDTGASLREIADATGDRDHMTVKRMLERQPTDG